MAVNRSTPFAFAQFRGALQVQLGSRFATADVSSAGGATAMARGACDAAGLFTGLNDLHSVPVTYRLERSIAGPGEQNSGSSAVSEKIYISTAKGTQLCKYC
jgi:hypothetical protein